MDVPTPKYDQQSLLRRVLLSVAFLSMVAMLVFCCFYLLSGYHYLVNWYLGLNSCFYLREQWVTDFFTPRIKSDGNLYCIIAIAISIAGMYFTTKKLRQNATVERKPLLQGTMSNSILPIVLCFIVTTALWMWGNHISFPAFDEVFSAANASGLHPFQAVSYYIRPNNHLMFNFLNSVLFYPSEDKVVTGRIISLIAYYALTLSLFFLFKNQVRNVWLALLISVTLVVQFPVWGFSFQARGYELYLLAEWGLFISLFGYIASNNKRWLYINIISCAIGYFCLPTFLYLHIAQLVFMLLYMLIYKKRETAFWKYQVAAIFLAYLFYLPTLCFSGIESVINNHYTAPVSDQTIVAYAQYILPSGKLYLSDVFSDIRYRNISFNFALLLAPLLLLFDRRNKLNFLCGLFYLVMWVSLIVMILVLKRLPFERNLIGHFSLTMAAVIRMTLWLTGVVFSKEKGHIARQLIFSSIALLFAAHFMLANPVFLKDKLYGYDVNKNYREIAAELNYIPKGRSVSFSHEAFYCCYIYWKNGYKISRCPSGNEDDFIKIDYEILPKIVGEKYTLLKTTSKYYEIYKRNQY